MTESARRSPAGWLTLVCGLIVFMVVFGGYVRLTRSGLSILGWNVISGVIPPIGPEARQAGFVAIFGGRLGRRRRSRGGCDGRTNGRTGRKQAG